MQRLLLVLSGIISYSLAHATERYSPLSSTEIQFPATQTNQQGVCEVTNTSKLAWAPHWFPFIEKWQFRENTIAVKKLSSLNNQGIFCRSFRVLFPWLKNEHYHSTVRLICSKQPLLQFYSPCLHTTVTPAWALCNNWTAFTSNCWEGKKSPKNPYTCTFLGLWPVLDMRSTSYLNLHIYVAFQLWTKPQFQQKLFYSLVQQPA